ncbi:hypothetical protein RIR_jg23687.t2 [Rhizophagus irregularis DAOM 181602=DAOM 197198]|nr:hypothetical protein RIR_jg23687.t2 [Rhizophagus irregularis DAOM 181602=DAOM 197198]
MKFGEMGFRHYGHRVITEKNGHAELPAANCPKRKRSKSSSKRKKFNDYGIMIVIILCTYIVIITGHRSSIYLIIIKFTISNKL